ncbi:type VI secretion system ImpA family protein [Paraburkholderia bannensis]|uniref:Type VI secretion system ImpA family protein n=1 Tax=Paraburkholderia bannensis TaxID=765414 RepID=A0A7W9U018_9BURK|nr:MULTISPECIES: type VI secretion system protein TssA [Paraburkholderia]MBB3258377.1 type VI secretion system ImpA family protein [Paraburkholderia sp. WP4_3_2]MBB6103390.1 type VI secretion system ImpA family protein [Paraburkholderia bannensis]
MSFSFDIETLLQPIPGDAPCGVSLLHDPALEAIKAARREDDPSLPMGVWQNELKVADWSVVEAGCIDLLIGKSKDLMLAAWLAEAWLHRYGWEALPVGLRLINELCERFWDVLHPMPRDGDWEFRAAPIAWVAGHFPGLLAGRIELCETADNAVVLTLARWESAHRLAIALADRKDVPAAQRDEAKRESLALETALRDAARPALAASLHAIASAHAGIGRLDIWCTRYLGDDAPALGALRDVLERVLALLREWAPMELVLNSNEASLVDAASRATACQGSDAPTGEIAQPAMPSSRESAYRQLALIGEFLLRYEPHSPVPYMIQRALEWGGMPLPELLHQLTEEGRGRALGEALGLLPHEK